MSVHVTLGELFDDLWSAGDAEPIVERRGPRTEIDGQLRLPDEFLPIPAGGMFA